MDAQDKKFMALSDHRAKSLAQTQGKDVGFSAAEKEALEDRLNEYQRKLMEATEKLKQSKNTSLAEELKEYKHKLSDAEHKIKGLSYLSDAVSDLRNQLEKRDGARHSTTSCTGIT